MLKEYRAYYKSAIGIIEIAGTDEGVTAVEFVDEDTDINGENGYLHPVIADCLQQIDEYFRGVRREFSVRLQIQGTDFQKKVWNELRRIPFGKTVSYRDIAAAVGNIKAVRAVGSANRNNRISIIIPCHRVIGSNGKLTGYAGGLWRKEWLLKHENGSGL